MNDNINVIFRNLKCIKFDNLSDAHTEIAKQSKCDIRDLYYLNNDVFSIKVTKVWIAGRKLKTPCALILHN